MVFSSLLFIFIFLPINLIVYYKVKKRSSRNIVLIISSLIFYAWGEPIWITLLIFSATIDYFHGKLAERYRGRWQSKAAVVSSLVLNLGLLIVFKYSGMIDQSFHAIFKLHLFQQHFSLPIGISFYTFQTISYVIDVYRGETKAQNSYLKFLMFVSLFHQLVAGPIVRYKDIAYEIEHRIFDWEQVANGVERFIVGLAKKVLIANTAGKVGLIFLQGDYSNMSMAGHWLGMTLFAFQIYFDFSGYSDMAIGLGKMFGFTYKENFNYPYLARTATDFWRRWHISLGSFFRDYLYIPLGGNRRHYVRNIIVVWFLTGLWHGASWNFVLWGLFYGMLLLFEKLMAPKIKWKLPRFGGYIYMYIVTVFGWTLFYFEDLSVGWTYIKGLLNVTKFWDLTVEIVLMNNLFFILLAGLACTPIPKKIGQALAGGLRKINSQAFDLIVYPLSLMTLFIFCFILLVGQTYNPFLYFRF